MNYAELNDVYLPPLGPRDIVGRDAMLDPAPMRTRRAAAAATQQYYIQEDYLAPRVRSNTSRRYRGNSPALEPLQEEAAEEEAEEEEEGEEGEGEATTTKDRLSSDEASSDQGSCDGNHVIVQSDSDGGDGGDDEDSDDGVLNPSSLHSSMEDVSSVCSDVEVGVASEGEGALERLGQRSGREPLPREEEEVEGDGDEVVDVDIDDSESCGSIVVDDTSSPPPLPPHGGGSGGRGAIQEGRGPQETEEVQGFVVKNSQIGGGDKVEQFQDCRFSTLDNFHQRGVYGTVPPHWGTSPHLMRGVVPFQNSPHSMPPPPIHNSTHLMEGVAPMLGGSPQFLRGIPHAPITTAHPAWGVASSHSHAHHILQRGMAPLPGPSHQPVYEKTGTKDGSGSDNHQLEQGTKYMF